MITTWDKHHLLATCLKVSAQKEVGPVVWNSHGRPDGLSFSGGT